METHYRKAEGLFSFLECHTELLRVLLEQVAYWEYLYNGQLLELKQFPQSLL
jgi:hypothetical protein